MDLSIFNNPAFSSMSPEKKQFLMNFAGKEKPASMREVMPFLIANMNQAKNENIDFSKPEIQLVCELLCKDLPPAEQAKVKKVMALMSMNKS